MKRNLLLILFNAFLWLPCLLAAQTQTAYWYDYDATGNRIRFRVVNIPKGSTMAPPADTIDDGITGVYDKFISATDEMVNRDAPQAYEEMLGSLKVKVYPNPTQGRLKVVIECNDAIQLSQLKLVALNGKTLYKTTNLSMETDIDITDQPSGVYLMQVQVNDTVSNWKIVKQ